MQAYFLNNTLSIWVKKDIFKPNVSKSSAIIKLHPLLSIVSLFSCIAHTRFVLVRYLRDIWGSTKEPHRVNTWLWFAVTFCSGLRG